MISRDKKYSQLAQIALSDFADIVEGRDWSKIETEEITQLWKVDKDILLSIEITTVFR